jgi:hypothetical protein
VARHRTKSQGVASFVGHTICLYRYDRLTMVAEGAGSEGHVTPEINREVYVLSVPSHIDAHGRVAHLPFISFTLLYFKVLIW